MNILGPLVQFHQQARIFHWHTSSYAEHQAYGMLYTTLNDLIDEFVETFIGKFGKPLPTLTYQLELKSLDSRNTVDNYFIDFIKYLESMTTEIPKESDLLNIRDEMLGVVNKTKYLLTLK